MKQIRGVMVVMIALALLRVSVVSAAPIVVSYTGTVTRTIAFGGQVPPWAFVGAPVAGQYFYDPDTATPFPNQTNPASISYFWNYALPNPLGATLSIGGATVSGLLMATAIVNSNAGFSSNNFVDGFGLTASAFDDTHTCFGCGGQVSVDFDRLAPSSIPLSQRVVSSVALPRSATDVRIDNTTPDGTHGVYFGPQLNGNPAYDVFWNIDVASFRLEPAQVPEPGTLWLLALGGAVMLLNRKDWKGIARQRAEGRRRNAERS